MIAITDHILMKRDLLARVGRIGTRTSPDVAALAAVALGEGGSICLARQWSEELQPLYRAYREVREVQVSTAPGDALALAGPRATWNHKTRLRLPGGQGCGIDGGCATP